MIVTLDANIFQANSTVTQLDLLALLQLGWEGRHVLRVDNPDSAALIDWLRVLPEPFPDEIAVAAGLPPYPLRSSHSQTREVRVEPRREPNWDKNPPALDVATALLILRKPLSILVENARSDRNFLMEMIPAAQCNDLRRTSDHGWCTFQNGGGLGELIAWLEEHRSGPNNLAHPAIRLRTWVLIDHDGDAADSPSIQSHRATERLQSLGVPHHQLRRRYAESYLSRSALGGWITRNPGHRQQRLERYRRLTHTHRPGDQAWHFLDLKGRQHFGPPLRDLFLDSRDLGNNTLLDPDIDPDERITTASSLLECL